MTNQGLDNINARLSPNAAAIANLAQVTIDLLQIVRLDPEAQKAIQIQAEQNRSAIREIQEDNRRIWQYLLSQQQYL